MQAKGRFDVGNYPWTIYESIYNNVFASQVNLQFIGILFIKGKDGTINIYHHISYLTTQEYHQINYKKYQISQKYKD
jgi:hypothetical protein